MGIGNAIVLIKSDLFRYAGKVNIKSFILHFFRSSPGFSFSFFFRLLTNSGRWSLIHIISLFFYKRLTYKYGFQIPKSVKIGKGFLLMHFGHVVINSKTIIGDDCNIYHGVTIGSTERGKNKGVPILGNKVWVGAGAVIVGGIIIGDNVLIAPNAYVNFSIPSNSVVIGNPAKIIPRNNATENYILNTEY